MSTRTMITKAKEKVLREYNRSPKVFGKEIEGFSSPSDIWSFFSKHDESAYPLKERILAEIIIRSRVAGREADFWKTMALVCFAPMLVIMRARIYSSVVDGDDVDGAIMAGFSKVISDIDLEKCSGHLFLVVKRETKKSAIRFIRKEQGERKHLVKLLGDTSLCGRDLTKEFKDVHEITTEERLEARERFLEVVKGSEREDRINLIADTMIM